MDFLESEFKNFEKTHYFKADIRKQVPFLRRKLIRMLVFQSFSVLIISFSIWLLQLCILARRNITGPLVGLLIVCLIFIAVAGVSFIVSDALFGLPRTGMIVGAGLSILFLITSFSIGIKSFENIIGHQRLKLDVKKQSQITLFRSLLNLKSRVDEYRFNKILSRNWDDLSGVEFEDFLYDVFNCFGAEVTRTPISGDHGADLIVRLNGKSIAIQAKGYSGTVGNKAVQEAYSGMGFYQCSNCAVVTNSTFTLKAYELADSLNCLLIDKDGLNELIKTKGALFDVSIS